MYIHRYSSQHLIAKRLETAHKFNRGVIKWIVVIRAVEYYGIIKKADCSLEEDTLDYLLVVSLGEWDCRVIFIIPTFYFLFFNKALVLNKGTVCLK